MTLLSQPPVQGLVQLINQKISSPTTTINDYSVIFPPVSIAALPDGSNTRVTVKTSLDYTHAGRATFYYKRVELSQLLGQPVAATINDTDNFAQFLAALTARYGVYFSETDFEPISSFDVSGGELSYLIGIRAKPDSYGYVGEGNVIANINWRLDDPELVEQETDRLRQLVNFTLPLSISMFIA